MIIDKINSGQSFSAGNVSACVKAKLFNDPYYMYLREINKIPLISEAEQGKLAGMIQQGDLPALNKLIKTSLRLVVSIAKKYANDYIQILDLVQYGNNGLRTAARRFDPNVGPFGTYATWWIRQAIGRGIKKYEHTIEIPAGKIASISKFQKVKDKLTQKLRNSPTDEEVAEHMNIDLKDIGDITLIQKPLSLDSPIKDGEETLLGDMIEDRKAITPFNKPETNQLREGLTKALEKLSPRERNIITLHFGLNGQEPSSFEDISKDLGITRQRVCQLYPKILKKLKFECRELKEYIEG